MHQRQVVARDLSATPDALAPPPGHRRFPLVDGARAIAASSIIIFHCGSATHSEAHWWGDITATFYLGVPLFFVISGFLLYRPFVAADVLGAPRIGAKPFLWRRALRIVPLYWFALTVIFLITSRATERPGGFWSGEAPWTFYLFGQIYNPGSVGGGLQQAWTLCIEMTFYLLLPVYALLALSGLRRRGWRWRREIALLAGLAGMSLFVSDVFANPANEGHLLRTLPSYFYLFAIGMALAVMSVQFERDPDMRLTRRLADHSELAWVPAALLFGLHSWVLSDLSSVAIQEVSIAMIAGLLILPAIFEARRQGPVSRMLGHPVVAWLGLVSYGLYLWHPQVLSALENVGIRDRLSGAGFFLLLPLFFALTAAVAGVTYYAIERPALRLKRRQPPDLRSLLTLRALRSRSRVTD